MDRVEANLTALAKARADFFVNRYALNAEDEAEVREDFRFVAWLWAGEYRDGKCSEAKAMSIVGRLEPLL